MATAVRPKVSIRDLLKRPGEQEAVSYYAIADATRYDPSYINRVFNGHRRPSLDCAAAIAAYLGCSVDQLTAALAQVRKKGA